MALTIGSLGEKLRVMSNKANLSTAALSSYLNEVDLLSPNFCICCHLLSPIINIDLPHVSVLHPCYFDCFSNVFLLLVTPPPAHSRTLLERKKGDETMIW